MDTNGCCITAIEEKVRQASDLLREAYEESECKWCARNLEKMADITSKMADIAPYTAETAQQVSSMTDADIAKVGGKVAVLHQVVQDANGIRLGRLSTDVKETFYTSPENTSDRGYSMDKSRAIVMIGGGVGIGVVAGFALRRLDEKMSVGKPWYLHIGPAVNVLGGMALSLMGMGMFKLVKGEKMQMALVAGGIAMMTTGALSYLEALYNNGVYVNSRAPASTMAYAPMGRAVAARAPGQLPVRYGDEVKAF